MKHYDVVIMGGGPAGSTLAALLARNTPLSVALYEKTTFPREHIGESFSHRVIGPLHESGALEKVLASPCHHRKYGGYYAWNPAAPATTRFDHPAFEQDGVWRWAIHVNRAEFDKILLDHARELGVDVYEGTAVTSLQKGAGDAPHTVELAEGSSVQCTLFVEASGRQSNLVAGESRGWLSDFKNVAIWGHFVGCRPAQSLDGDWNIFRAENRSPIGSFAWRDGWYWYIPVPRKVDGEWVPTHSIGMVTDPQVLKDSGRRYLDMDYFLERAKEVPLLGELMSDAQPFSGSLRTATNYSMISDRFCSQKERWLLLGDSAFFVDPLFSSGVAFSMIEASSASRLIAATLIGDLDQTTTMDLWRDYNLSLQKVARSFALAIDQWYHAIADAQPESVYWQRRGRSRRFDFRDATFQQLVDTNVAVPPDLAQVMAEYSDEEEQGPLAEIARSIVGELPSPDAVLRRKPGTTLRRGKTLDVGATRGTYKPWDDPDTSPEVAAFWRDPLSAPPSDSDQDLTECFWMVADDDPERRVKIPLAPDESLCQHVASLLEGGATYKEALADPHPLVGRLINEMIRHGLVETH